MVAGARRLCARASAGEAAACRGAGVALAFAPAANAPTTPASDFANPLRFRVIVLSPCRSVLVAVGAMCRCWSELPPSIGRQRRGEHLYRAIVFVEKSRAEIGRTSRVDDGGTNHVRPLVQRQTLPHAIV